MAWVNNIIIDHQGEFLKLTNLPADPQNAGHDIHIGDYKSDLTPAVNEYNQWITCDMDIAVTQNMTLYEDSTYKLYTTSDKMYLNVNGSPFCQWSGNPFSSRIWRMSFWGCIDESTQKGIMGLAYVYQAGYGFFCTIKSISFTETRSNNDYTVYQFLKSALPVLYTWQSVPSISGKNGILSLVTIDSESINDGEPVSGAAVSVFDQNPVSGNNVKDIVDGNTPLIPSAVDVTATFIISNPPVGELASRILAAKKGFIPESIEDADKTVSIPANASNVTMPGLDENSQYYFAIFVADAAGDTAVSDPKDIYTSADEGWSFDYTGEIVEWTAPKTGIYQLETWGAQGGDATDGTLTARGGYGAYAVGEVFLTQGDTLYINVGGQNGYGGGGVPPEYQAQIDQINGDSGSGYDFYWKSYTTWDGSHLVEAPFDNYSWSKKADESQDLVIDGRPFDTRYMYPNTKFDVYIDGEGSSYQLKLHDYQGREDGINWAGSRAYKCYANTTQLVGATPSTRYTYDYFLNNYVYYTGTISGCLDYIIANFRNVNIYVNGVQWASV